MLLNSTYSTQVLELGAIWLRGQIQAYYIAGGFFTVLTTKEAPLKT